MRWLGRRGSGNVEDRRMGGGGLAIGGGVGVVAVILSLLFGGNPEDLLSLLNMGGGQNQTEVAKGTPTDEQGKFVSVVLADTEDVWNQIFNDMGEQYREPTLVLFRDQVQSACGFASSASGPFYCPPDQKVYIDLAFYDELQKRFGAPGDFAQAYVIAHEVGHHVQNLLGLTQKLEEARGRVSEKEYNQLSVRLELQADFLAGVWAHHDQKMNQILESGDIEEALAAANAIGDDRLQRETQGSVTPDSFTHGTSQQRMRWFKKGFETGDIKQGDTFSATEL